MVVAELSKDLQHFPIDEQWLARWSEEVIDPALPIVDSLHHLWLRDPPFTLEDFAREAMGGHNVRASIFVECTAMYRQDGPRELRSLGETEYVNGAAAVGASGRFADTRFCAGIVGWAELALGDRLEPVLEAHVRAAGPRFKGIRRSVAWDADQSINRMRPPFRPWQGMLGEDAVRRGLACVARLGLSYEAHLFHPQLPELTALAAAVPELTIVVDHIGGLTATGVYAGRHDEEFPRWQRDIRELARQPNVVMKIGGLAAPHRGFGFELRDQPPSSTELASAWQPWVETCIEAFGAERCMFESNFPVDKAGTSYVVLWNAFKRLTAGASRSEQAALFAGTACRIYGLELPNR